MRQQIPEAENTAAYQVALGTLQYRNGSLEDALASAQAAIDASGDEEQKAQAYLLAANIYEEMGDDFLSEEIEWLEMGFPSCRQPITMCWQSRWRRPISAFPMQKEPLKASARLLRPISRFRQTATKPIEIRLSTAIVQYRLKDFAAAEQTLLSLQEAYPDDYRVYKWLAFVADAEQARQEPMISPRPEAIGSRPNSSMK